MTGMDRLTDGQRRALYLAVAAVLAGMAMGFLSSFDTLYHAAASRQWTFPWLLPLAIDSGILAYVVLDHLAVTLGSRSRCLHAAAWVLAAFTVWANAAVSTGGGTWRVIHAAMPALWVLGVEALRFTWKRVHEDPAAKGGQIPFGRYLAAPLATARMRRRMWLHAETSYPRAVAIEDARLHAADLMRAAVEAEPSLVIPGALRRTVRSGRLPASVIAAVDSGLRFGGASEWEPEVAAWITSRLTLPERLAAQLRNERETIAQQVLPAPAGTPAPEAPQTPAEAPAGPPSQAPAETPRRAPVRKGPKLSPRQVPDADLAALLVPLLNDDPDMSIGRAMEHTGTARPRARRVLEMARAESAKGADVIQMAAR